MEKRILNDLETFYNKILENCNKYDYFCNKCPQDEICDKVADLIVTMNKFYQEEKE